MKSYHFVGVDIAKSKFDVYVEVDRRGYRAVFENRQSGFKAFQTWLGRHRGTMWVCLEATGSYGIGLAEFLTECGLLVSVINPMQIKNYGKAVLCRHKTDPIDAKLIAEYGLACSSRLKVFKPLSDTIKTLRESVQLLKVLDGQKRQLLNQLESTQSKPVKKERLKCINSITGRMEKLEEMIGALVASDEQLSFQKKQLMSIPGIGDKSAHQLLGFLPDLSLFSHAKQLVAFAGLSPKQHQSGKYAGKTKLSKLGSRQLRRVLYMPALVAKNYNPVLKAFGAKLSDNGLRPKSIICAVMRKLLHIIFGLYKNGSYFDSMHGRCQLS